MSQMLTEKRFLQIDDSILLADGLSGDPGLAAGIVTLPEEHALYDTFPNGAIVLTTGSGRTTAAAHNIFDGEQRPALFVACHHGSRS